MKLALIQLVCLATIAAGATAGSAQVRQGVPKEVENIGVEEHLDALLPLDEMYFDESGRKKPLSEYFFRKRPVIISFNYSSCPQLCDVQLTGLVRTLQQMELKPGQDFEFISLSIDPREKPSQARVTRDEYVARYGDLDTRDGWHFLTGSQDAIDRLTTVAGFKYNFVKETNEYAHTAVFVVCTPEGRIGRYLYGVDIPPKTMRLSLVEVGQGIVGNSMDQLILWCFSYDPNSNSYVASAAKIMRLGGVAIIVILAAICVPFWFARPKRRANSDQAEPTPSDHGSSLQPPSVGQPSVKA